MATDTSGSFTDKYLMPLAVLLGLILIAVAVAFGGRSVVQQQGGQPAGEVDIANVSTENSPIVGERNAPVTVAVWYDYQCGHCQNYEKTALRQVIDQYVASGDVRIVYKDYQFFGEESDRLSAYGRAVYEADASDFDAWMSAAMAAQADEAFGTDASIKALLGTIEGVDAARVSALVEEKRSEYAAAAAADRAEGASFGITGTPGTIIGTTMVPGSQSFATLQGLIDAELAK